MVKIQDSISDVKEMQTRGEQIFYLRNKQLYINFKESVVSPSIYFVSKNGIEVWLKDDKWDNYVYNIRSKELIRLDFNLGFNGSTDDGMVIFKDEKQRLYSTLNHEVVFAFDEIQKIAKYLSFEGKLVFVNDSNILKLFTATAQPLWQFDLSTLGEYVNDSGEKFKYEVEKFIGLVGNSLLVLLRQKEILVIDIETGDITQRMKTVDSFLGETIIESVSPHKLPFFITLYFLREDRGVVYALFLDALFEIRREGDSFKTRVFGLKSEMEKHDINPRQIGRNTFYFEDKIYFLEQEFGRFGILNVENKKIEYVSDAIEINGQGIGFDKLKEIQATTDKVYVLDKTNTLHIFEKA